MGLEIERKYRILSMDDIPLPPGIPIDQGYLANNHNTVRVRVKAGKGYLTIKCATDEPANGDAASAVVCQEFEYEIPLDDARKLLNATKDRIQKTRHHLDNGVELDIFHGRHEGLIMAEFESDDGAQAPVIPGVRWREVSVDRRYSNAWMARNGIPDIDGEPLLKQPL